MDNNEAGAKRRGQREEDTDQCRCNNQIKATAAVVLAAAAPVGLGV